MTTMITEYQRNVHHIVDKGRHSQGWVDELRREPMVVGIDTKRGDVHQGPIGRGQ